MWEQSTDQCSNKNERILGRGIGHCTLLSADLNLIFLGPNADDI